AVEHAARARLAGGGTRRDRRRVAGVTTGCRITPLERWTGEKRLHAAALAAVANRPVVGDAMVAPLAGDVLWSRPDASVDDDSAADPGAEDHAEGHPRAARRAGADFGEREAVGVVLQHNRQSDARDQVLAQPPTVEAGRVRVLECPVARGERARR